MADRDHAAGCARKQRKRACAADVACTLWCWRYHATAPAPGADACARPHRFESLVVHASSTYSAWDTGASAGTALDAHGANHGHTFVRNDSECPVRGVECRRVGGQGWWPG